MRAKKSLGQNFLVDPNLQRKIVESVEPDPGDTVIEIGPGQGALTELLAGEVGMLVAVELDDRLARALSDRFAEAADVTIIHTDVLEWEPGDVLRAESVKVVGNIPYNITSPLLFRVLEWRPAPERIVVMVQREVADRILAEPGQKTYGALTVGLRAEAQVRRLFHVGRNAFRPVPSVDSSVIEIRPRAASRAGGLAAPTDTVSELGERLRDLTRAAFGMRRKQLQKILRTAPGYGLPSDQAEAVLEELGIPPTARPETLGPETFVALAAVLDRLDYPRQGKGDP